MYFALIHYVLQSSDALRKLSHRSYVSLQAGSQRPGHEQPLLGILGGGSNTTSSDQWWTCALSSKIVIGRYWYLTFSTAMMTELGVTKSNCAYSAHQANNITTTLIARSISILALQSDIHASHQIGIPPQLRFICIDPNRLIDWWNCLPRSHILYDILQINVTFSVDFPTTLVH